MDKTQLRRQSPLPTLVDQETILMGTVTEVEAITILRNKFLLIPQLVMMKIHTPLKMEPLFMKQLVNSLGNCSRLTMEF